MVDELEITINKSEHFRLDNYLELIVKFKHKTRIKIGKT